MKTVKVVFSLAALAGSALVLASISGQAANTSASCKKGGLSGAECACQLALDTGSSVALQKFLRIYPHADTACNAQASTANTNGNSGLDVKSGGNTNGGVASNAGSISSSSSSGGSTSSSGGSTSSSGGGSSSSGGSTSSSGGGSSSSGGSTSSSGGGGSSSSGGSTSSSSGGADSCHGVGGGNCGIGNGSSGGNGTGNEGGGKGPKK